jgi:glutamate dehydrogenase
VQVTGAVYFELGARLRLGWLRRCAQTSLSDAYWDQLAVKSLIRELYRHQRRLTAKVLESLCTDDTTCHISVDAWQAQHSKEMERYQRFIDDLKSQESIDLSMLIVAARNVESICAL